MGFNDRSTSGVFCRIASGKVVRNADQGTPGAIRVEKKDKKGNGTGEFKYEIHNDTVDGRIVRLQAKVDQYNGEEIRKLTVTLNDGGQIIHVDLNEKSRYWQGLMYALPNVDFSKPVELAPYDFIPKGDIKPITGMNIKQDGQKVQPAFTKETPGKLPQPVITKFDGKDRYDFFDQRQWLLSEVLPDATQRIQESLGAEPAPMPTQATYVAEEVRPSANAETVVSDIPDDMEDDSLPF